MGCERKEDFANVEEKTKVVRRWWAFILWWDRRECRDEGSGTLFRGGVTLMTSSALDWEKQSYKHIPTQQEGS